MKEKYLASWVKGESLRRAEFISKFFIGCSDRLLDVGTYKGELKHFLPPTIVYYPIDIRKINLPNARIVDLNKGKIPFKTNSFDFVVCCDVLEHLFCPEKIAKELNRVLKPSGFGVISLPNELSIPLKISRLFKRSFEEIEMQYYKHHWSFDLRNSENFLRKFFLIEEKKPYVGKTLARLYPILRFFPSFCSSMFFKVRKKL